MTEITLEEYYMGRDVTHSEELSDAHRYNAKITVDRANALLEAFGEERRVTSGWRPAGINAATPNASPVSKHVLCQAVDLEDKTGTLDQWCAEHEDVLAQIGLWREASSATPTWTHIQIVPPHSGHRVFYP
jgi:hypothetical protein